MCVGGLDDGVNGMMTYVDENTRYVWISQDMGVGDVWKLLEGTMGVGLKDRKVWYNIKFDRSRLIPFENDANDVSLMRVMMVMHICALPDGRPLYSCCSREGATSTS